MEQFFSFIRTNSSEILLLILTLIAVIGIIQWLSWIFSWGRFKDRLPERSDSLRYLFADLLVKIINDFRHLLALIIVLIFAGVLVFTLSYVIDDQSTNKVEDITTVLQAVVASLGGIVGSIIGYYFGESVAQKRFAGVGNDEASDDAEQDTGTEVENTITQAPPPLLQKEEDEDAGSEEENKDNNEK